MLAPVVNTIEVPCSQEKAFGVFVEEIDTWWPLKYSVSSLHGLGEAKSVSIEPRVGGKIVETAQDNTLHIWGTVREYDPFEVFSMDFHMGLPAPESASVVEVRFTALSQNRTRVTLRQSNWEAFGDRAKDMQSGYGSAWTPIFEEAFKVACGG